VSRSDAAAIYLKPAPAKIKKQKQKSNMKNEKVEKMKTYKLSQWNEVQAFLIGSICPTFHDTVHLMRQKILNENYLTALQRTRLVEKLTQLKQKYFTGSTLRQVKRTIQTSKNMKQLCHVVWEEDLFIDFPFACSIANVKLNKVSTF